MTQQTPYLVSAALTYNEPLAAPPGPRSAGSMVSYGDGPLKRWTLVEYAQKALAERGCYDYVFSVGWVKPDHPMNR
jgi:hypothetical protein